MLKTFKCDVDGIAEESFFIEAGIDWNNSDVQYDLFKRNIIYTPGSVPMRVGKNKKGEKYIVFGSVIDEKTLKFYENSPKVKLEDYQKTVSNIEILVKRNEK